jgi:dynein regulatory complex protein 1
MNDILTHETEAIDSFNGHKESNDPSSLINTQPSQFLSLGLPQDGGRDARIAQRKNRIEQNRLAKAKPVGQQDGIYLLS